MRQQFVPSRVRLSSTKAQPAGLGPPVAGRDLLSLCQSSRRGGWHLRDVEAPCAVPPRPSQVAGVPGAP